MRRFYLGTHEPHWLRLTDVPLFVSARRLRDRKSFPKARGPWALDSGGFTELKDHGRWTVDAATYAAEASRWCTEVGMPDFAAPQDWMCEPWILEKTGKTVAEHQALTIESLIALRSLEPNVPWMPVLQGWACDDYLDHMEQYAAAGVDLSDEPIVGVGTICKRQSSRTAARIIRAIALHRIQVHAFGVKTDGIGVYGDFIESADSMVWSHQARWDPVLLAACTEDARRAGRKGHKNCANCLRWALEWRAEKIVREVRDPEYRTEGERIQEAREAAGARQLELGIG